MVRLRRAIGRVTDKPEVIQTAVTAEAHAGGHLGDKKKVFGDDSEAVN